MIRTSTASLLVLAALASTAGAQEALPLPAKQQERLSYDEVVELVGSEEASIDAAADELGVQVEKDLNKGQPIQKEQQGPKAEAKDLLAGNYIGKMVLSTSRIKVEVSALGKGRYAVTRTKYDGNARPKLVLRGEGSVSGKKSFLGLTVLKIDFPGQKDGMARRLNHGPHRGHGSRKATEGNPSATYKFNVKTGMLKEVYKGADDAGAYTTTAWREGAIPVAFPNRVWSNTKTIAKKIGDKFTKVKDSLKATMKEWAKKGRDVGVQLALFADRVIDRMIKAGKWTIEKVVDAGKWTAEKAVALGHWTAEKAVAAGKWTVEAAIEAGKWTADKAVKAGYWTVGAAIAAGKWTVEKAIAAGEWTVEKAIAFGHWTAEKALAVGAWTKKQYNAFKASAKAAGWKARLRAADLMERAARRLRHGAPETATVKPATETKPVETQSEGGY